MIVPTMFEKNIKSGIEITFVTFEAPTIIPAEHKDPISAKEIPRISSKSQFGPKQIVKPKKANTKAISFNGFMEIVFGILVAIIIWIFFYWIGGFLPMLKNSNHCKNDWDLK